MSDRAALETLWHDLGGSREIGQALLVASVANRAAFMLTYGERVEPSGMEAPADHGDRWTDNTYNTVQNLLYNCISNGGADFCPHDVAEKLLAAGERAWRAKIAEATP